MALAMTLIIVGLTPYCRYITAIKDIFKERVTLNEQDLSASGICIKRTRKYVNNTEGANNLALSCVGT